MWPSIVRYVQTGDDVESQVFETEMETETETLPLITLIPIWFLLSLSLSVAFWCFQVCMWRYVRYLQNVLF